VTDVAVAAPGDRVPDHRWPGGGRSKEQAMAALAWFLEDFALPFSIGMFIGIVAEWVRPHLWDLTVLVRSTLLLRQIHAEHRSRTPDGSAGPGGGNRRGPSPGGEVRDPCTPHLPAMNTAPDVRDPQAPSGEEAGGVSQRSVAPLPPASTFRPPAGATRPTPPCARRTVSLPAPVGAGVPRTAPRSPAPTPAGTRAPHGSDHTVPAGPTPPVLVGGADHPRTPPTRPPAGDTCPTKSAAISVPTATATTATATPAAPPTAPAAKTAQPRTAPEKARS
jgi:hypothetical protein